MCQIAKAGLEIFDVSSPKELQDYLNYLTYKMDSAGTEQLIHEVDDETELKMKSLRDFCDSLLLCCHIVFI